MSLQPFKFFVSYRPGVTNKIMDFLSRCNETYAMVTDTSRADIKVIDNQNRDASPPQGNLSRGMYGRDTTMKRNLPERGHCQRPEVQPEQGCRKENAALKKEEKTSLWGGESWGWHPLYGGVPMPIRRPDPWRGHKNPTG